jgi:Tfp pilus assembly protein PilF
LAGLAGLKQPSPIPLKESAMIPKARFRYLVPFAILLSSSLLSLSQQNAQTVTLIGEIKIARGSFPPRRIEITLETRGAPAGVTYADNEGKFLFAGLWPNLYYVVIRDLDFEPVRQQVEIRALSGNSKVIQVTLIPKVSTRPASRKDETSGENQFIIDKAELEKHYPKKAVKEFEKGNKSAQKNEADAAIGHYKRAVSLAPDFYAARNNLGLMHLAKHSFPDAEQQFREAMRLNPTDSRAYFNLGNTCLLSRRLSEAQAAIQEGLQRRPDSTFGQFLLATVYSRTGNPAQAELIFQRVLTIDPGMSKAHLELVNLYLQQNKNSEAISELKAFLKVSPDDPFAPKAREVLSRLEQQPPVER